MFSLKERNLVSSLVIKKAKHIQRAFKTVALAESCTGGQVSAWLSALPGSSRHFWGGVVCYSLDAKKQLLGVVTNWPTSMDAAQELAKALPPVDVKVGVVGNLGPTSQPGSPGGQVSVCLIAMNGVTMRSKRFGKSRLRNRLLSSYWVLDLLERSVK